jgi:glutamate-ammonia-ligase adenylyltransferase
MEIATLVSVLDHPHLAAEHLQGWGLVDVERGRESLLQLADAGLTLDLLAELCGQLGAHLPKTPDPDAALAAFRRYLFAVRSPLSFAALVERDSSAMPMLLAGLSLGPRWSDLLIADPEAFDLLRQTEGQPFERPALFGDVLNEVAAFQEERSIITALARLRSRHLLRIAYGEIVCRQRLELVLEQLSLLADVLIEAAFGAAERHIRETRPLPPGIDARPIQRCVVALGRLGASELAYAGPIELLVIYSAAAADPQRLRAVHEHFERASKLFVRLFNESRSAESDWEARVLSLPDSPLAAAAHAAQDVVFGFDSFGRTWHRQTFLKARPAAGDLDLGVKVLSRLEPWLYRRYLSRADETGVKSLKRRILMEATLHQDDWRDVRLARGGLRDLESTVEFLQLLVGGDQPAVRQPSTLAAIAGLEQAGAISPEERSLLEDCFVTLRKVEHRLQIFASAGAAALPDDERALERIARSLGAPAAASDFLADWRARLGRYWQTFRKLLDSAFAQESFTPREVELLLDPAPPADEVRAGLAPFGFARPEQALANLHHLAEEQVAFLSTRRCRHLLAGILPRLLAEVAATPNPDQTLDNVARVSDSLGAKGVLWDLFRASPPTLQLYVRLCSASPYLSDILTTNPGMLDELVDSLQLDKLPPRAELSRTLEELCRGAEDTLPVLHDFKNAQHLRIGVRDILGKEDIDRTHAALADVAETCLAHVAGLEYGRLVGKFGAPTLGPGPYEGEPCRLTIIGLGRLGGRDPNYHSHLDVLLLYEGEGTTRPVSRSRQNQRTANNHFFTQLAQGAIKQLTQLTPKGRLYSVDTALRPIGVGGALALSQTDFAQHFASGSAPVWQWLALCQARPVYADVAASESTQRLIHQLLVERPPRADDPAEVRRLRSQLEKGASSANLKRGPGGTLDVELLVQRLQLEHAAAEPTILSPNTQDALVALAAAGVLDSGIAERLGQNYRFLRRIEAGLRLQSTPARHDLPSDPTQLGQLALLLGHSNPQRLREQSLDTLNENRAIFNRLLPEEL